MSRTHRQVFCRTSGRCPIRAHRFPSSCIIPTPICILPSDTADRHRAPVVIAGLGSGVRNNFRRRIHAVSDAAEGRDQVVPVSQSFGVLWMLSFPSQFALCWVWWMGVVECCKFSCDEPEQRSFSCLQLCSCEYSDCLISHPLMTLFSNFEII